jgi:hypothetical protein
VSGIGGEVTEIPVSVDPLIAVLVRNSPAAGNETHMRNQGSLMERVPRHPNRLSLVWTFDVKTRSDTSCFINGPTRCLNKPSWSEAEP